MFKFTSEGIVELGGYNPLSEEDLQCIAEDIAAHTALPTMRKVNGIWQQRSSMEVMDRGYRIHESQEEEDTVAQLNSDLDDIRVYNQLAEVTDGV